MSSGAKAGLEGAIVEGDDVDGGEVVEAVFEGASWKRVDSKTRAVGDKIVATVTKCPTTVSESVEGGSAFNGDVGGGGVLAPLMD